MTLAKSEDSSRFVVTMRASVCGPAASAASPAPTDPAIKEPTKGGGRRRRPPPFVGAARSAASFIDVSVGTGEAADTAKPHTNVRICATYLDESADLARVILTPLE